MDTDSEIPNNKISHEEGYPAVNLLDQYSVVLVIPAYNEERFIGSVVLKLLQYPVSVIVVDDGSSDETARIAKMAGAKVLQHLTNLGKGQALSTGFREARSMNPDAIVIIDGDGQHMPEQLPVLLQPVLTGEADIVVGSRYLGKTVGMPAHRAAGHWFFNYLIHLTSGIKLSDSQSGYRAFSPIAYNIETFRSSDFTVESEMQFIAKEYGLRVVEVPITIRYMDKPTHSVWKHGLNVLNGILHLVGQYRPLLFLGGTGVFVMLAGFSIGVLVVDIYSRTKELAVGYTILCVLMTIIGMVLLSTGITLHSIRGLLYDFLYSTKKNPTPPHKKENNSELV